MAIDPIGTADAEAIGAIRAGADRCASVPILAELPTLQPESAWRAKGFDGAIATADTPIEFAESLVPWRPDGEDATIARLEGQFGEAPIREMLVRLRDLLKTALVALDDGTARDIAHRVAGVAGTLGFGAASAAWLALSDGAIDASDDARRTARRSIALIDRHGWAVPPQT